MRVLFPATAVLCACVASATPAHARTTFATEPHILAFDERLQIVLFAGDTVAGAIATRRPDGSWDVVVPQAEVVPSLVGRTFAGAAVTAGGGSARVSLEATPQGDVRVRVVPSGEVGRVVAYGVGSPPRLMIDLLAAGAEVPEPPDDSAGTRVAANRVSAGPKRTGGGSRPGAATNASGAGEGAGPGGDEPAKAAEPGESPKSAASGTPAGESRDAAGLQRGRGKAAAVAAIPDGDAKAAPARGGSSSSGDAPASAPAESRPDTRSGSRIATARTPAATKASSRSVASETDAAEPRDAASSSGTTEPRDAGSPADAAGSPVPGASAEAGGGSAGASDGPTGDGKARPPSSGGALPADVAAAREAAADVAGSGAPRTDTARPAATPPAPAREDATRPPLALAAAPAPAFDAAVVARRERESPATGPECDFRRVAGVPYCAPDGDARGYVEQAYTSGLARRLAAGDTFVEEVRTTAPAGPYLAADRELVVHAQAGWLLPAVAAYERAVRMEPTFPDAARAHMNIALVYAELGFDPELAVCAEEATNPARGFAAALLGDRRLAQGRLAEAEDLYERAAQAGGAGACLAARGFANVALVEGRIERARRGLEGVADLCPRGLVDDPETQRLQAQVELASGDAHRALATLAGVAERTSLARRGDVLREQAGIAEAAGRIDEAARIWEELATGGHGATLEAEAAIALARLAPGERSMDEALARLGELPARQRDRARRELLVDASGRALAEGDGLFAVAMVLSEGLDPASLDAPEQIRLAGAYRRLGLIDAAAVALGRVESTWGAGGPEPYWEERGRIALLQHDLAAAEDVLRHWERSRGGNPSAGALELRAEILVRRNASPAELEVVLDRLTGIDADRGAETRWRIAGALVPIDRIAAREVLGEGALAKPPGVAEKIYADTLWRLGRAAEEASEPGIALEVYGALADGLPGTVRGADAAYRAARLLEQEGRAAEARRVLATAATHPGNLDRRLAESAVAYHDVIGPLTRQESP